MIFAVPINLLRPNALASHHINHPISNIRTYITILRKNELTNRKKTPTLRRPNNWHNLHSRHPGTNLPNGTIPIGTVLPVSLKHNAKYKVIRP
jgi:hypothetical protein